MNFGIESVAPLAAADVVLAGSGASAVGTHNPAVQQMFHKQIIIQLSSHLIFYKDTIAFGYHVLEDFDPYCIDTTIVRSRVREENCLHRSRPVITRSALGKTTLSQNGLVSITSEIFEKVTRQITHSIQKICSISAHNSQGAGSSHEADE